MALYNKQVDNAAANKIDHFGIFLRTIIMTKAVLILNLGTPAEPTTQGVRDFYKYFFADPYVFDMAPLGRWLLRNLIILPFRAPKTAKQYQAIWTDHGSPLKVYTESLQQSVQASVADVPVLVGMGYSEPFIDDSMAELERRGVTEIVVLPLFPQYSTATTASVFQGVKQAAEHWVNKPRLHFIDDLYAEPAFIKAWSSLISKHLESNKVDHVIFSYHGLPEKNIQKADGSGYCQFNQCCDTVNDKNRLCYRAQCMATTRSIVEALNWQESFYSIAFQSRFGRQAWIQPYLENHIISLAESGKKRIAVVTPSFTSDCLETIFEIGVEYKHIFVENGGADFYLVPNLNDEPAWFEAVAEIVENKLNSIDI